MLTKALTAIVLTGALWVTGDAAYQNYGSNFEFSCPLQALVGCCHAPTEGCTSEPTAKPAGCCSSSSEESCKPAPKCCTE